MQTTWCRPDVYRISSKGLIRDAAKSIQKLDIYDEERPIGIQIFGGDLEALRVSAEIVESRNPDLLDINYGCPVMKVVCKMAGAGILQDISKMVQLTEAVVKSTRLPVTVKTRLGWDENTKNIVDVAERLQDIGIKALAIHGRTRKQMYKGEADWTLIAAVKNNPRIQIPIFGNGDIDSPQKALEYKNKYGVDGIMIGRAAIGAPWIFNRVKAFLFEGKTIEEPRIEEKIEGIKIHLQKSIEWKGNALGILEMRQHYSNYLRGLPNIKPYRTRLVMTNDAQEIFSILEEILREYAGVEAVSQ